MPSLSARLKPFSGSSSHEPEKERIMEYIGLAMLIAPHIFAIGLGKITPEWWRLVYLIYFIVAIVLIWRG